MRRTKKRKPLPPERARLLASAPPAAFRIVGASEAFELQADEAGADGKPKLKKFSMVAYTGAAMRLAGFMWPVVIDLEGMQEPRQTGPILKSHDADKIVGHWTSIELSAQRIKLAGVLSGAGKSARQIVETAANGFPWQASIGANATKIEFVDREETVKVNGRNFTGPLYVARGTVLGEVSFVPIGADGATSATVAAARTTEDIDVNFSQWLAARGLVEKDLTESDRKILKAAYDAEQKLSPPPVLPPVTAQNDVNEMRRAAGIEAARQLEIRRACPNVALEMEIEENGVKRKVGIQAHALANGWTREQTELAVIRAERATPPATTNNGPALNAETRAQAIEAALLAGLNLPNREKQFKPEILEAADRHYRFIGLHQLLLTAASENGMHVRPGDRVHQGNLREVLTYAFLRGASTLTLPGILGNVANKQLLSGYTEEDDTWREISRVTSASNFHTRTYYRMLDNMEYEEIGPDGKIKHGSVDQESYTASLKTFAKMFSLTRRDMINDDLSAFDDLRTRLGRGAKKKFNNLFWTNMLAGHSTFFTAARGNYITGATTTLLTDGVGLGLGVKAFRQMKSPSAVGSEDGAKRINARPSILLVPPELEYAADNLFMGEKLNVGSGPGDQNIYRNKYRPVVSAWLSDTNFTGYSTTAWYLFRAASDLAMMVVSFLNGMEAPTVESAEADFDTLGMDFRGYHDFHADQAEYLCGVKSKGAA